jgi:hypothetical protein
MDNRPVGVYDSGLGGLTVWREIRRQLPEESLVYLGDGKNCPYGARPADEICRLADEAVGRLVSAGQWPTTAMSSVFFSKAAVFPLGMMGEALTEKQMDKTALCRTEPFHARCRHPWKIRSCSSSARAVRVSFTR